VHEEFPSKSNVKNERAISASTLKTLVPVLSGTVYPGEILQIQHLWITSVSTKVDKSRKMSSKLFHKNQCDTIVSNNIADMIVSNNTAFTISRFLRTISKFTILVTWICAGSMLKFTTRPWDISVHA
jgi:hypothetical protein